MIKKISLSFFFFILLPIRLFSAEISDGFIYSDPLPEEKSDSPAKPAEEAKKEAPPEDKKEAAPAQGEWGTYLIHVGDKIKIVVQGEKELSDTYTVDENGDIHFPLLNKIHADGLTSNDFRENLRAALAKDFLTNPQVEMTFEESISNSVTILGQVSRPGTFILPPNMTFLRMISVAGGFNESANYATCKVVRTAANDTKSSLLVDVEAILDGKVPDFELQAGDVVFVPKITSTFDVKEGHLNSVSILGQVQKPSNYDFERGLTLIKLISEAGGFTPVANSAHVRITRKMPDGAKKTLDVNADAVIGGRIDDPKLEEGDIIYVPESMF